MRKDSPPVILLLGNYRPTLTLARDLKQRGYRVIVSSLGCDRSCRHSNAVSQIWDHSSLKTDLNLFAQELRELAAKSPNLEAIFPVSEEYVRVFAERAELFVGLPPIVTMASQLVKTCLDKSALMQLAIANDITTAPFAISRDRREFAKVVERIGFPLIIRPEDSTKRLGGQKALIVDSNDELSACAADLAPQSQSLLIQQKFTGVRHNVYFAAFDGTMTRCLHAVIERTDNPNDTGLAVRGRTISTDNQIVEDTSRLVGALAYTGIGCAQFLVNEQTGETSFLEINPRIAGNHALPEFAGLKLAEFMIQLCVSKTPDLSPITGRAGIRYGWISGDLMGAKVAYLRNQIGKAGLFVWFLKALANAATTDVHMVFSKSDPMPSIYALIAFLPRVARWRVSAGLASIAQTEGKIAEQPK